MDNGSIFRRWREARTRRAEAGREWEAYKTRAVREAQARDAREYYRQNTVEMHRIRDEYLAARGTTLDELMAVETAENKTLISEAYHEAIRVTGHKWASLRASEAHEALDELKAIRRESAARDIGRMLKRHR